jgi:uncharacterized protein YuzB (UPF0349 family)
MILSIGESLLFHLRNDFSYLSPMKAMAHQIEKMTALLEVDQKVNVCTWSCLTVFICSLNQYCALVSAVYRAATEVHFWASTFCWFEQKVGSHRGGLTFLNLITSWLSECKADISLLWQKWIPERSLWACSPWGLFSSIPVHCSFPCIWDTYYSITMDCFLLLFVFNLFATGECKPYMDIIKHSICN